VQPAQRPASRLTEIILDEIGSDSVLRKATGLPGFHKIAAIVAVNYRLDPNDTRQARLDELH
jgi:hypothetical protein